MSDTNKKEYAPREYTNIYQKGNVQVKGYSFAGKKGDQIQMVRLSVMFPKDVPGFGIQNLERYVEISLNSLVDLANFVANKAKAKD